MSGRVWPQSLKFPTLRIRAKILAGFAVVLAISAASMGIAYLGFERVSAGSRPTASACRRPISPAISIAS
jgi:CHASE3 domain sensor protein